MKEMRLFYTSIMLWTESKQLKSMPGKELAYACMHSLMCSANVSLSCHGRSVQDAACDNQIR